MYFSWPDILQLGCWLRISFLSELSRLEIKGPVSPFGYLAYFHILRMLKGLSFSLFCQICQALTRKTIQIQYISMKLLCLVLSRSVVFDSVQPHGLQHTRLLCPWDFPGKNTGVSCHFLLHGIFLNQGSNLHFLHCKWILYCWAIRKAQLRAFRENNFYSILDADLCNLISWEWEGESFVRGSLLSF